MRGFKKDIQYYKFCLYGFLKNLRFFEAFLILFFLSRGFDYWQIGVFYTIREISRSILEIPSGLISDNIGRRSSLALSFLLYIASYLVFYYSESFGIVSVAMFLYAVGDAFRSGTHKAMIYSYLQHNKRKEYKAAYYGNTRSWSQFGSAICSIGGAAFIWYSGNYSSVFLFSVIPAFLDMLLIMSYPSFLEKHVKNNISKSRIEESFKNTLGILGKHIKEIDFWHKNNLTALHSGFYKTVKDYLQPILAALALSVPLMSDKSEMKREAVWVGVFYFIIYILSSMASRSAGFFSGKIKKPQKALNISMYSGFFAGIAGGFLAWQGHQIISVIILIFIFMIENIRKPFGLANISDNTSGSIWASVLSIESQTASLYSALMAPLLGLLADINGPGFGLSALSIIAVLFALTTGLINRNKS